MRKMIWLVLIVAVFSIPAFAGGMSGGSGAPEIDANTAVTALSVLVGWATIVHSRWRKRNHDTRDDGEASHGDGDRRGESA